MVAGAQPPGVEQLGQALRAGLQLAVGDDLAGASHDDGGGVGSGVEHVVLRQVRGVRSRASSTGCGA